MLSDIVTGALLIAARWQCWLALLVWMTPGVGMAAHWDWLTMVKILTFGGLAILALLAICVFLLYLQSKLSR